MKMYIYHYCCTFQNCINGIQSIYKLYGLYKAYKKIDNFIIFEDFKKQIWEENRDKINPSFRINKDDMRVDSLSFLHEVDE